MSLFRTSKLCLAATSVGYRSTYRGRAPTMRNAHARRRNSSRICLCCPSDIRLSAAAALLTRPSIASALRYARTPSLAHCRFRIGLNLQSCRRASRDLMMPHAMNEGGPYAVAVRSVRRDRRQPRLLNAVHDPAGREFRRPVVISC